MTLNLLTQVPEGIIMLSDSMVFATWPVEGEAERVSFEHARKLFHLGDAPAAVMINGSATIGSLPIAEIIRRVSRNASARASLTDHDACIKALSNWVSFSYDDYIQGAREKAAAALTTDLDAMSKINADRERIGLASITVIESEMIAVQGLIPIEHSVFSIEPPEFLLIVGSYFENYRASTLSWPGGTRTDLSQGDGGNLWWWGSGSDALVRLVKGVDFGILLRDKSREAAAARKYFEKNRDRFAMECALDIMPVQQAIYFTKFLADVSCGFDRFKVGRHTVGGEIDMIALVDGKLKWIHKQRLTTDGEL